MKMLDAQCGACGALRLDFLVRDDGVIAPCACGGVLERVVLPNTMNGAVHGDDIPGGLLIKHGLCNPDGTPKRYDTHSSIRKAAEAAGYTNYVTHTGDHIKGSDKSKHTVRWI